jgi:hypothetical protein
MIFRNIRTFDFRKTIMRRQEQDYGKNGFRFFETVTLKHKTSSSNPAAGHNGQGARTSRKDGCHPKYKNHGRIAGC